MVAFTQQSVDIGAAPNDDSGDDTRASYDKLNKNFDEVFGAITFETGGAPAIAFDAGGSALLNVNMALGGGAISSNRRIVVKEGTGVSAALDFQDTDNTSFVRMGMARATNDFFTGTANLDCVLDAGAAIIMGTGAVERLRIDDITGVMSYQGGITPKVTEVDDLGSITLEFDNLFVQNSPTVSDKREKDYMGDAVELVPMLKLLKPVIFSRKARAVKASVPEQILQRQKIEIVSEEQTSIEIIDGAPVAVTKTTDVKKPVFKMMTIKDESGNSIKRKGKVVKYPVPVMEDYTVPAEEEVVVLHGRPHTGFMAQDVKQAMDDTGVVDWAGYAYHNENGEDKHVLRLMEFVGPVLAYVQELEARIEILEQA